MNLRSVLVTGAAVGAAAVGGGAIASAATSSTTTPSSRSSPPAAAPGAPSGAPPGAPAFNPSKGGHTVGGRTETLLTGTVAAKVRAAALKKVSGTVERVETNVDDSAPYEAHIAKPDGTQVIVEVNRDFTVHAVQTMGGHP
jgi:hypothetical protein